MVQDENLWNTSIIIPLSNTLTSRFSTSSCSSTLNTLTTSNTLTSHSSGISDDEVPDDVIAPEIESEPRYNLRS